MHHVLLLILSLVTFSVVPQRVHEHAHAHNDYEHARPLRDALLHGFISVEADVYLVDGELRVSHFLPDRSTPTLEQLYISPLDSLLKVNDEQVYSGYAGQFYLMIDFKSDAIATYRELQKLLKSYPLLLCDSQACPVKIFISGNRPVSTILDEGYRGLALDGRPGDLGKGFTVEQMPVISDHYSNWSSWKGNSEPAPDELSRIRDLATRVHAEGKKLRLWAIPDHEPGWSALLDAGVDLLNTDRLEELSKFLRSR
jgi:hypothetical protein